MDENKHEHEWNEDLECKCGAKIEPPEPTTKRDLVPKDKPAIQIIVELRKKIVNDIDEAMEEILNKKKP